MFFELLIIVHKVIILDGYVICFYSYFSIILDLVYTSTMRMDELLSGNFTSLLIQMLRYSVTVSFCKFYKAYFFEQ